MVYVLMSGILFGCVLLVSVQNCWSNIQPPSRGCTSQDCMVDIDCMVINLEYVECNWTRSPKQDLSYNFSSAFHHVHEGSYRECQQYVRENGQNVGCRVTSQNLDRFSRFYTKLLVGGKLTVARNYTYLKERVKLNPPYNLSVNWTANSGLCLQWESSVNLPSCEKYMVRHQRGSGHWKDSPELQYTLYCIPLVPMGVNYTLQVKSTMGENCGTSLFWSDWSAPLQWSNYTGSINKPSHQSSQFWWQLWVTVFGVIVLMSLAVLLCHCERVKVLILPVFPDPSKNLQDLFRKYNGNVERWIQVSGETFETNYTEFPCVVCEPSPALKAKMCDGPLQQHSA